jgi:putative nucleotidyltransferase with HDIG domain
MFAPLLTLKRKIKRLLKVQTESRQVYIPTRRSRALKIVILVVFSALVGFLYPGEVLFDPFDVPEAGDIAQKDIVAPFQITLAKSDRELREEQDQARFYVPFVLDYDSTIVQSVFSSLDRFINVVRSLRRSSSRDTLSLTANVDSVAVAFPMFSQTAITKALTYPGQLDSLGRQLKRILSREIYDVGVIQTVTVIPEHQNKPVLIRRGEREQIYQRSRLLDLVRAKLRLLDVLQQTMSRDSIDQETYYSIGQNFIQPNLFPNIKEYDKRVNEQLADIEPLKKTVNTGDVIVGARQKVSEQQAQLLKIMATTLRNQAISRGSLTVLLPAAARLALILATFAALYLFLFHFRRRIYNSNPKLLALFLVFAVQLFLVWIVDRLGFESIYVFPVAVLPILVTNLFDAEIGILATISLAILLGIMHGFSFPLTLLTVVVGVVACFSSRSVRKRTDFYRVMFLVVISYVAVIFAVENLKLSPGEEILTYMAYGVAIGLISVLLTTGILPIFESLFGITTDITLLELSDLNHPLLKRLAIEAPGTYHHSLQVGNLSEAAAEAIDANPLLARVGAYYHDIGKIEIPEYFVENQLSVKSKHDSLTPSMSALILASHVKKGRLLGEEADIPDDVLNFIEEHHGTMVMSYFYNKAVEQGADPASKDKFRYPGPKPQTRETGIAMLADAVEAASRTLDDPKPARIDNLIQRIIDDRFSSGELDECPLTLKDLAKIRESFAQILIAAFHHRVEYPREDKARVG